MKVTRLHSNQDAMQSMESKGTDDIILDRVVYRKISSLTDNRTLLDPIGPDSKFDRFLLDMNKIHRGETVDPALLYLDKYLGNLGETIEYPFRDDTYYVEPWIEDEEQFLYRNVVDDSTGTVNNIIDRATGDNVIHNTGEDIHISGTRSIPWQN